MRMAAVLAGVAALLGVASAAPAAAQMGPPPGALRLLPPDAVAAALEDVGIQPLGRPVRLGWRYEVRGEDARGVPVRVAVDGRTGAILSVAPAPAYGGRVVGFSVGPGGFSTYSEDMFDDDDDADVIDELPPRPMPGLRPPALRGPGPGARPAASAAKPKAAKVAKRSPVKDPGVTAKPVAPSQGAASQDLTSKDKAGKPAVEKATADKAPPAEASAAVKPANTPTPAAATTPGAASGAAATPGTPAPPK